jgi:hypothetical protein
MASCSNCGNEICTGEICSHNLCGYCYYPDQFRNSRFPEDQIRVANSRALNAERRIDQLQREIDQLKKRR